MTAPSDNRPYSIIADAYLDAGLIQANQAPNAEQLAKGMRRLRDLINFWMTKGIKLWLNSEVEVPLVAGQAEYSFGPSGDVDMTRPLRTIEAYYLYAANNTHRPLTQMAWKDYILLSQTGTLTTNRGTITQYLIKKEQTFMKAVFWQCPDDTEADNGSVIMLLQRQVTSPLNLTEEMNFPIEWRMALHWGLADDLATGQPQAIMDRCQLKAEMYRTALEDWDVEDAPTRIAPDVTMTYSNRSFR